MLTIDIQSAGLDKGNSRLVLYSADVLVQAAFTHTGKESRSYLRERGRGRGEKAVEDTSSRSKTMAPLDDGGISR